MHHANDNDTIPLQRALNDLLNTRGVALLSGLYADDLLTQWRLVHNACAMRGLDFTALRAICDDKKEHQQHPYLVDVLGTADLANAFQSVSDYHTLTVRFWEAIAAEYTHGKSEAREDAIDTCRGDLVTALWEMAGVGTRAAEELIRRNEKLLRTEMAAVSPDYSSLISR